MALPPQMTAQQIQEMLNVAAPNVSATAPDLYSSMAGSNIAYIPRPTAASYSPDNLPEFMRNFTQVTPQTFAPSQGVFDIAPILDSIQGTMPQNYISEYQPLEQAFQESIAIDPSMFGGGYRSGLYMPTQTLPAREGDGVFDIAESLAAVAGLRELYPYAEEAVQKAYDPVEEFVQQNVLDPVEETVQQVVLDPVEEVVQQVALDPAEDLLKVVGDPTEEFIQQIVLDPIEDVVKIPLKEVEKVLPEVDVNIDYKTISEILSGEPTPEPAPEPTPEPTPEPAAEPVVDIGLPTESIDKIINDVVFDPIKEATEPQVEIIKESIVNPILEVAPEVDVNFETQTLSEIIENLTKEEPKLVEEQVEKVAETQVEQLKDSGIIDFSDGKLDINITLPKIPVPDTLKEIVDNLGSGTTNVVEAYANIENLIENPSGVNADKAVEVINNIGFDSGASQPIIPPEVGGALADAADVAAIVEAFENPDAESLTNAYAAADSLKIAYSESGAGLPAGEAIGNIGTILSGIEDLDNGIESPAEAINVVNAANLVSGFASNLIAGQGVGAAATGAAASGFMPESFTSVLGPLGTVYGITQGLGAISNLAKGGAAGNYPRVVGNLSFSDGRIGAASNVDAADVSESGLAGRINQSWAQETFNSATQMTNDLIDNYGFELDQAKAEPLMKIQSNAYYNREGKLPANAPDFVVKLLQSGALKPTENTPPEILSSNEAFGSFLDSHLSKGQDLYAAKMYDISNQSGPLFGAEHAASAGRTTKAAARSKVRFATQESAQNWIDSQTPEQAFWKSGSGNSTQFFVRKPSYSLKEVDVKGKTFYEINRSENIKRIGGRFDNMSELKLKYADKYKTQEEAQKYIEGLSKEETFSQRQTGKYPDYYVNTPVYSVVQSTQNGQPVYSVNKTYSSKEIRGNSLADARTKYEKEKQAKLNPVESSPTPSAGSLEWYQSQYGPDLGAALHNISGLNLGDIRLSL